MLTGTIINSLTILAGSAVGLVLRAVTRRSSKEVSADGLGGRLQTIIMQGMAPVSYTHLQAASAQISIRRFPNSMKYAPTNDVLFVRPRAVPNSCIAMVRAVFAVSLTPPCCCSFRRIPPPPFCFPATATKADCSACPHTGQGYHRHN